MALRRDHEYGDALDALSAPNEATPGGLTRRGFLGGLLASSAVGWAMGAGLLNPLAAGAAPALPLGTRRLVVFTLGGGNDGLATVPRLVPASLTTLRPDLLLDGATLLALGDGRGFHPALTRLHAEWLAGRVTVVGSIGASGNLSHFEAMDEWMCVGPTPSGGSMAGTGWFGRWLDDLGADDNVPLRAASLTGKVPLMMTGRTTAATALPAWVSAPFGGDRDWVVPEVVFDEIEKWGDAASGTSGTAFAARLGGRSADLAVQLTPTYQPQPAGPFGVRQATMAGRLLNTDPFACRAVFCSLDGYDTHANQLVDHADRMGELDASIAALFDTLRPEIAADTTLLVHSEFGRRVEQNGNGTDHGVSSYSFVVGAHAAGGLVGQHVDPDDLDEYGNTKSVVKHLDLIGSVLTWLGADANEIIGKSTASLPLFA